MLRPTLDSRDKPARRRLPGSRYRDAAQRRWVRWRHRGDAVECPCCDRTWGAFAADWNRRDAICPGCGAHERHRALSLFLEERTSVSTGRPRVLHFSPEYALETGLRRLPLTRYVTADIDPERAEVEADLTALPFEDASFDLILCSHVLEHVEDDGAAIAELARVLAPGGQALVLVPVDQSRAETYEDPAIQTPDERQRAFWQADHLRLYGRDLVERLSSVGLRARRDRFVAELPGDRVRRHGLDPGDDIYVCTLPPSS